MHTWCAVIFMFLRKKHSMAPLYIIIFGDGYNKGVVR